MVQAMKKVGGGKAKSAGAVKKTIGKMKKGGACHAHVRRMRAA